MTRTRSLMIFVALVSSGAYAGEPVFETIELSRPSTDDVKFKIDVPAGTQVKVVSSRVVLSKGANYTLEVAANKQTIAEVKEVMTGSDSGWSDVKLVKETPTVIVFKGEYLGQTRTRIHSSVAINGFWLTCSNAVSAMVDTSAISDMIRSCESLLAHATGKKTSPGTKSSKKR